MKFSAQSKSRPLNAAVMERGIAQAAALSAEQAAYFVLEEAEAIVPVDTGDLRESGHVKVEGPRDQSLTAKVIFDADHAAFVEFGTGVRGASSAGAGPYPYDSDWPGMVAQPYIRPALDTSRDSIIEVYRDNLALAVKTFGKG